MWSCEIASYSSPSNDLRVHRMERTVDRPRPWRSRDPSGNRITLEPRSKAMHFGSKAMFFCAFQSEDLSLDQHPHVHTSYV